MILHENRLPADDSHERSCLIFYFWKSGKICNRRLLQIIGGALRVKCCLCFCRWRRARQWDRAGWEDVVTWSVPVVASWYTDKTEQVLKVVFFTLYLLTLNAPIATKVVCFSCLLKCLRSLYGKQCGPRSDCSYRSSLFWVHSVCFYT